MIKLHLGYRDNWYVHDINRQLYVHVELHRMAQFTIARPNLTDTRTCWSNKTFTSSWHDQRANYSNIQSVDNILEVSGPLILLLTSMQEFDAIYIMRKMPGNIEYTTDCSIIIAFYYLISNKTISKFKDAVGRVQCPVLCSINLSKIVE